MPTQRHISSPPTAATRRSPRRHHGTRSYSPLSPSTAATATATATAAANNIHSSNANANNILHRHASTSNNLKYQTQTHGMVDTIDGNNNMDTASSFAASAALSSEQQQQQQPSLSSGRNRNSEGKENEIPSSSNQVEGNSNQTSPLTSSVRNVNFEFDNRGKKENASTSLLSMGAVRLRYDDDCVNDDDDDDDNTTNNNHGGRMEVEHDDVGLFDACNDASCSGDADNGNYDYNNYNDEVQDDDDDDEDGSECSGDTVIAQDDNCPPPPPPNATHEQWNQYYWEWCYGPVDAPATNLEKRHDVDGSWSAMRCAPSKSCLSTRKIKQICSSSMTTPSLTPRILHQSPTATTTTTTSRATSNININGKSNLSTPNDDDSPHNAILLTSRIATTNPRIQSAVKFGTNSAAEFDFQQPITEMTPIPTTVVQQIFPMDEMETEKEMEEEGVSRETARNVALLAEWDDDFDSIVDDFDEDANDADAGSSARRPHHKQRGRKRTPFKLSGGRRRSSSSRPEKSRRESSIFSRERKSLLDDSEDDSNGGLPFSVTIDPGEYTSPSSSSLSIPSDISTNTNDDVDISISTIGATPAKDIMLNNNRDSLDSTTSAYVSPSSLKSFATSVGGFESNSSSTGKETPNSARTSSSTILRAVHASGALLPSNSPQAGSAGGLRPNQLKYSPSNSTGRSASSPSDDCENESLGSDIMSMFNGHSIDDIGANLICKQLSILSNHPVQMFHITISDLVQWIGATQEDPLDFINNHIFKHPTSTRHLALIAENDDHVSIFSGNAKWLQSVFYKSNEHSRDETSYMQRCFETILRDKIMEACISCPSLAPHKRSSMTIDGDVHTISSCMKQCIEIASADWSKIELEIANRSLRELQEWSKRTEENTSKCNDFLSSCCTKLIEVSQKTVEELSNSKTSLPPQTMKKLKIRKRKVMSQIEDEMQKIKALEEDLTVEVERLNQSKRAKQIFCAHLAMERSSPLAVISEEIRTFISPAPVTINATDFTFPLLDGAAEVAMQLSLDDESSKHIELGCFIRDGGASMKLLQAFLLGNIDNHTGNNLGPFPLRSSLSSMIHQNDSREDSFIEASQLFLRIDTLARCVRMLETECFCTIDSYDDKHITLAISIHNEGEIIQIAFSFKDLLANDWNVTTMPSNVDVEIVSNEKDLDFLANQLQEKARNMISTSSPRDPILLRRICDNIMECFSDNR